MNNIRDRTFANKISRHTIGQSQCKEPSKLFSEKQELSKRKISHGDAYNAAPGDLAGEHLQECPQKRGLS